MRRSTFTSLVLHKDYEEVEGFLGTYRLVSVTEALEQMGIAKLNRWEGIGRWRLLRQLYATHQQKSIAIARFEMLAIRRRFFYLSKHPAINIPLLVGPGHHTIKNTVGLSLRSIYGFSRQLFNTPRALTRGVFGAGSGVPTLHQEDAQYRRLTKSRAQLWMSFRARNFGKAMLNRRSPNRPVRIQLFKPTRVRTVAWWALSMEWAKKFRRRGADRILVALLPTKGTDHHAVHYCKTIFNPTVFNRGHEQRFVRRVTASSKARRFYDVRVTGYNFAAARRDSRLRDFPQYWRKTRRVVPMKKQRSDWVYRETGHSYRGNNALRSFGSGATFDGSTAQLSFMFLEYPVGSDFRTVSGAVRNRSLRIAKSLKQLRRAARKLVRHQLKFFLPSAMARRGNQVMWNNYRGKPWLRYRRADRPHRALYRRFSRIFANVIPKITFARINALYRIRKRVGLRSATLHRRAMFFRLRRKWVASFGLNRNTGIYVSAMDGAVRSVYEHLGSPYFGPRGVSNYLTTSATVGGSSKKRTSFCARRAALLVARRTNTVTDQLMEANVERPLETLLVSGFAYDAAVKSNVIRDAMLVAPYRMSLLGTSLYNDYVVGRFSHPGAGAYIYGRDRQLSRLGVPLWKKTKAAMYRRKLGFVDKFLAYAIIRGGTSATQRVSPVYYRNQYAQPTEDLSTGRFSNTAAIAAVRSEVTSGNLEATVTDAVAVTLPARYVDYVNTQSPLYTARSRRAKLRHWIWTTHTPFNRYKAYGGVVFSRYAAKKVDCVGAVGAFVRRGALTTLGCISTKTRRLRTVLRAAFTAQHLVGLEDIRQNVSKMVAPTRIVDNSNKGVVRIEKYTKYGTIVARPILGRISADECGQSNPQHLFAQSLLAKHAQVLRTARWIRRRTRTSLVGVGGPLGIRFGRRLAANSFAVNSFKLVRGAYGLSLLSQKLKRSRFLLSHGLLLCSTPILNIRRIRTKWFNITPTALGVSGRGLVGILDKNQYRAHVDSVPSLIEGGVLRTPPVHARLLSRPVSRKLSRKVKSSKPRGRLLKKRRYNRILKARMSGVFGSVSVAERATFGAVRTSSLNSATISAAAMSDIGAEGLFDVLEVAGPVLLNQTSRLLSARQCFTSRRIMPARLGLARAVRKHRAWTLAAMRARLYRIKHPSLLRTGHEKMKLTETYFRARLSELETNHPRLPKQSRKWVTSEYRRWWSLMRARYSKLREVRWSDKPFSAVMSERGPRSVSSRFMVNVKTAAVSPKQPTVRKRRLALAARHTIFGSKVTVVERRKFQRRLKHKKARDRRRVLFSKPGARCFPEDIIIRVPVGGLPPDPVPVPHVPYDPNAPVAKGFAWAFRK